MSNITVEQKLFQNRYRVDAERPHIRIRQTTVCEQACQTQPCATCCPAGCYTQQSRKIELITDGCLECGACRIVCQEHYNLDWDYPRGGFGIQYKFG